MSGAGLDPHSYDFDAEGTSPDTEHPSKGKLWQDPSFPKKGWAVFGVEDSGDLVSSCAMCFTPIRYEFTLLHPTWGTRRLHPVGCVCAGHLIGNIDLAREMQADLEKSIRFARRKRWRRTPKGHAIIEDEGVVLLVFRKRNGSWGVGVKARYQQNFWFGTKQYASELDAKRGAYIAKLEMLKRLSAPLGEKVNPSWQPPTWHQ